MNEYFALVVDNDENIRRQAAETGKRTHGLRVVTAGSLEEAEARLVENFFNVALVDLQLVEGADKDLGGVIVLNHLRRTRPSCRRILLTQHSDKYRREVFRLLDPRTPVVASAVDKLGFEQSFRRFLKQEATDWIRAPVLIDGLTEIVQHVRAKKILGHEIGPARIQSTDAEIDFILSRVFGQRAVRDDEEDPPEARVVHLRGVFTAGHSRSVVSLFQPGTGDAHHGLLTVVKIGPRVDAVQELRRYDEYVRFRVSLHRRVELLGAALGDTLAAICYSFAGHAPEAITDLQSLLDVGDRDALRQMDTLFGPGAEEWLADEVPGDDEGMFFSDAYGLDPVEIGGGIRRFLSEHGEAFGGRLLESEVRFPGANLRLPSGLGAGRFRDPYTACVVHGDLNASNVLVDGREHVMLIDFRHTRRGPRCLDFCALQVSARLAADPLKGANARVAATHKLERLLWSRNWADPDQELSAMQELPYWAEVSRHLLRHAYRSLSELTPQEHAVTTLLYALRVFSAPKLGRDEKFRLVVWMSALAEVVADPRLVR